MILDALMFTAWLLLIVIMAIIVAIALLVFKGMSK